MSRTLPADYPPARHVLRDLGLWTETAATPPVAGLRLEPAMFEDGGALAAPVLPILVDVLAGGAALAAAEGGWVATTDMTLTCVRTPEVGELEARGRVLRTGRTNVVIETTVVQGEVPVAHGTVAFARLEPQGEYQRNQTPTVAERFHFADAESGWARPFREAVGLGHAGGGGALSLPITPYVGNSLGAVQGGVVAGFVGLSAECEAGGAVTDATIHFLALGRTGPLVSRARTLRRDAETARLRVEVVDAGANDRLCAVGTVGVAGLSA